MKYESWEKRLLHENDLSAEITAFLAGTRAAIHIDRHVALALPDFEDVPRRLAACRAGLALLHHWERQRHQEFARYVEISRPELIIDDAWLADRECAPLPHVHLWIARTEEGVPESSDPTAPLAKTTGDKVLDNLLFDGTAVVRRREGKTAGAWLVSLV